MRLLAVVTNDTGIVVKGLDPPIEPSMRNRVGDRPAGLTPELTGSMSMPWL